MLGGIGTLAQRFVYVTLIMAAVGLMILGKADTVVVEQVRIHVTDVAAPILDGLSRPVDAAVAQIEDIQGWLALREENRRLVAEREQLLRWQQVARQLQAENASLRQLLNVVAEPDLRFVSARVVADTGGAFANSLLINAGNQAGIAKGQVVVGSDGLVGRIAGAGPRSARVLLITDLNSRVPVVVGPARIRAILAGDNSARPRLLYVAQGAAISAGDRVVTSGQADAFPPGLDVGVVASVDDSGIRVKPFIDRHRLEYVRVIDYLGAEPVAQQRPRAAHAPPSAAAVSAAPPPAADRRLP
jgi:rod shape-determining protein MreC